MLGDDLLEHIQYDRVFRPDSGIAKLTQTYYNSLYSELPKNLVEPDYCSVLDCDGNEDPETITDLIELFEAFATGKSRRVVRVAIRIACREALRNNRIRTAPSV